MMEQAFSRPRRKHGRIAVIGMAGLFALLVAILLIPVSLVGAGITGWIVFCIVLSVLWRAQFVSLNRIKNKIVITGQIKELQYTKKDEKTGREIVREDTYLRVVDFKKYLNLKTNNNITISGGAGSGKTQLTYYIIDQMKDFKRIIMQFDPQDKYDRLGIPVLYLDKYAPNVFSDPNSMSEAWETAFSADATTSRAIPDIVKTLALNSHNWHDFKQLLEKMISENEKGDMITIGALNAIQRQLKRVYMDNLMEYRLPESIVINFRNMDLKSFIFYVDFLLRSLHKELLRDNSLRQGTMLFIDEAKQFQNTEKPILPALMALIRKRGAMLIGTQFVSDLRGIRGNARTQFAFTTNEGADLDDITKISMPYHWAIQSLQDYEFIDLAQTDHHQQIWTMKLSNPMPEFKPIVEWKPIIENETKDSKGEGSSKTANKEDRKIDYQKDVLEFLSQAGNISELGKRFAERYGGKEQDWKRDIKEIPKKMVKLNEINLEIVDYVKFKNDKPIISEGTIVYFRRDENPSGLHTYLVNGTADVIFHKGITNFQIMPSGVGTADIESEKYALEIESGLKNAINDIKDRITYYKKQGKETIIIVPNQETKNKYLEKYPDVKVLTLPELWEAEL
jgi:hypothetical protein